MSDTPRTDAKEIETLGCDTTKQTHYSWKFARTLERENADLRAQIAAKDAEIADLRKDHARLDFLFHYGKEYSLLPAGWIEFGKWKEKIDDAISYKG